MNAPPPPAKLGRSLRLPVPLLLLALLSPLAPGQPPAAASFALTDAGAPVAGELQRLPHTISTPIPGPAAAPPVVLPGWPKQIGVASGGAMFAPTRGLAFADLDLDGRLEIIRSGTDGKIYAWYHDGRDVPGFPRQLIDMGQEVPTVADLDGDGLPEILLNTRGMTTGGRVYVLRRDGADYPGWPKSLSGNYGSGSLTAADLDGDGKLEVIAQERAYPIGKVHVFHHDGRVFGGGWPAAMDHVPASSASVADVDGDGKPEVVCLSYNSLYLFAADGSVKPGFPYNVSTKHAANFSYQSPALADLDRDGKLEIVTACHKTGAGCYVFRFDGTLQPGWPRPFSSWSYSPPTVADLDGDGWLDVTAGVSGGTVASAILHAWDRNGVPLPGFPVVQGYSAEGPIAVADIDQDGVMELLFDHNGIDASGNGLLRCVDAKGAAEPGFPLSVSPGPTYMCGATLGDVDGDGVLDLGVVTSYFSSTQPIAYTTVTLYQLPGPVVPGPVAWKCYKEGWERRGLARESDRFAVTGRATPGGLLRLEHQGAQAALAVALLGGGVGLLPLGDLGVLRLSPAGPFLVLQALVLGASGRSYTPLQIPNSTALLGGQLALQGFDAGPAAPLRLRQMQLLVVQ